MVSFGAPDGEDPSDVRVGVGPNASAPLLDANFCERKGARTSDPIPVQVVRGVASELLAAFGQDGVAKLGQRLQVVPSLVLGGALLANRLPSVVE